MLHLTCHIVFITYCLQYFHMLIVFFFKLSNDLLNLLGEGKKHLLGVHCVVSTVMEYVLVKRNCQVTQQALEAKDSCSAGHQCQGKELSVKHGLSFQRDAGTGKVRFVIGSRVGHQEIHTPDMLHELCSGLFKGHAL